MIGYLYVGAMLAAFIFLCWYDSNGYRKEREAEEKKKNGNSGSTSV